MNAKFDQNPSTNSKDTEHKQNFNVTQGPQLCLQQTKNNV